MGTFAESIGRYRNAIASTSASCASSFWSSLIFCHFPFLKFSRVLRAVGCFENGLGVVIYASRLSEEKSDRIGVMMVEVVCDDAKCMFSLL